MGKARQPGQKKRHHFVPRTILRRFTNGEGRFWLYRKKVPHEGVIPAHPDTDFFRKYFYSSFADDGSRDPSLEDWFSGRENVWGPALDRTIAAAQGRDLSVPKGEDRALLGELLYHQWVRTPDFLERVATVEDTQERLTAFAAEFEAEQGRSLTNEEREAILSPEAAKRILQNTIVEHFLSGRPSVAEGLIREAPIQVLTTQPGLSPFLIGSLPIAVIPSASAAIDGGRLEVWFPIASQCALVPVIGDRWACPARVSENRVRAVNEAIFAQSDVIACVDREMLEQLVEQFTEAHSARPPQSGPPRPRP